jgi:HEAT repeat protein
MRLIFITGMVLMVAGCHSPSTEDWLGQLHDPDVVKRRQAIRELAASGSQPESVVPALIQALRDENAYVRRDAAVAIAHFGDEARDALPALKVAINDQARTVRLAALSTLKKIGPSQ